MPQSLLTGQLKEKPTYRVRCLCSSFVHALDPGPHSRCGSAAQYESIQTYVQERKGGRVLKHKGGGGVTNLKYKECMSPSHQCQGLGSSLKKQIPCIFFSQPIGRILNSTVCFGTQVKTSSKLPSFSQLDWIHQQKMPNSFLKNVC
jgi:hypothetical protein